MKSVQLLSCLLFTGIALHGMDKKQIEPHWKSIDCNAIQKSLKNDYELYLKNRLEEYKKTDFTPADMRAIQDMGCLFTGRKK